MDDVRGQVGALMNGGWRGATGAMLACLCLTLASCATPTLRAAVPQQLADKAQVVGLSGEYIRFWGDEPPKNFAAMVRKMEKQRRGQVALGAKPPRTVSLLVISGGGSDGAFGAGLLNGWTQSGKRPKFAVVTGVSTGALMAPFAFLGSRYDHILKEFYTKHSTKDIIRPTVLAGLIGGGSAVGSSEPLAKLIEKYLTPAIMREIAAEHLKGRRLLVGTTNLDAERPVTWDLGEIAVLGNRRALQLMRRILLASAAIPGVFPPVLIDVSVAGKRRQEMHVDGGTTDNAILVPVQTNVRTAERTRKGGPRYRLYIIVNSHTDPQWKNVKSSTVDIAGRSIATLIKQQTIGDVLKLYDFARKNKIRFNLATVPKSFNEKRKEAFDRAYMTKLFKVGETLGKAGYKWRKTPPVR